MTTWFTSDTHFGHENIIKYCNRPFKDVDHMNEEIIRRWNHVVDVDDTVYHLGDVALGKIDDSLACVSRLNGFKILVNDGNHDRPFMSRGKEKYNYWFYRYNEVFDYIVTPGSLVLSNNKIVNLSHFPYDGDSQGDDRYADERLPDTGRLLIHGHTHEDKILSRSKKGTLQIHVGQDAWDYTPVSEEQIMTLIGAL